MKKTEIVAKEKGGVEVGRITVEMPETLDDAIKIEGGSKEEVLKHYLHAKVIAIRAGLYPKSASTSQSAGSKKSVYDKAMSAGMSKAIAIQVSGYNPDAPVTPVKK